MTDERRSGVRAEHAGFGSPSAPSSWRRVGSALIDATFLLLVLGVLRPAVRALLPAVPLISLVGVLVAQWVAGGVFRQTVGKCLLGLSIVGADGSTGRFGRHCARAALKSAWWALGVAAMVALYLPGWRTGVLLFAVWAANPLFMMARRDGRALHDVLSGTAVVAGLERRRWLVLALTPAALTLAVAAWGVGVGSVARVYWEPASSMEPTVAVGDCFLAVRPGRIAAGDLVVHRPPPNAGLGDKPFLRRVIAVAGEPAPRTPGPFWTKRRNAGPPEASDFIVPPGCLWVMGDNRRIAVDSDDFGPLPQELVAGRVVAIVWPPWRVRRLDVP